MGGANKDHFLKKLRPVEMMEHLLRETAELEEFIEFEDTEFIQSDFISSKHIFYYDDHCLQLQKDDPENIDQISRFAVEVGKPDVWTDCYDYEGEFSLFDIALLQCNANKVHCWTDRSGCEIKRSDYRRQK